MSIIASKEIKMGIASSVVPMKLCIMTLLISKLNVSAVLKTLRIVYLVLKLKLNAICVRVTIFYQMVGCVLVALRNAKNVMKFNV